MGLIHIRTPQTDSGKIGSKGNFISRKECYRFHGRPAGNPNLMEEYWIIELATPKSFIGTPLKDITLTNRFGVQVIVIKRWFQTGAALYQVSTSPSRTATSGFYRVRKQDLES